MVKIESRGPKATMADAKEFADFATQAEPTGCKPGPCLPQPPGPPTCLPPPKCVPCTKPPNVR